MSTVGARLGAELRATLTHLATYFAVLAAIGYALFALLGGELISAIAAADQQLEWMRPKPPANPDRYHASLPPRLRGPLGE